MPTSTQMSRSSYPGTCCRTSSQFVSSGIVLLGLLHLLGIKDDSALDLCLFCFLKRKRIRMRIQIRIRVMRKEAESGEVLDLEVKVSRQFRYSAKCC
jgi:hypothetical protein